MTDSLNVIEIVSGCDPISGLRAELLRTLGLGVLGMPGFTAYGGLRVIGRPQAGETVVVAAASGPVGSLVGQLAQLAGARAVGIAGGPQKCAFVNDELRFDAAVDHRAADFPARLATASQMAPPTFSK